MLAGSANTIVSVDVRDLLLCWYIPMGYLWYIYILFILLFIAILTRKICNCYMLMIFGLLYLVFMYFGSDTSIISSLGIISFLGNHIFHIENLSVARALVVCYIFLKQRLQNHYSTKSTC